MSTTATALIETKHAVNAQTTEYTSAAGVRTIIDKVTGYATLAATLTINVVPSGSAAAATNVVVVKTFVIGEAYTFPEVVGHILAPGDFLSILCGTASAIVIRASGRQVS